jgi:ATP-binding cassette subfamily C protein
MRLLAYFVRAYPLASSLMLASLLLGAAADAFGMSTVLALLSVGGEGLAQTAGGGPPGGIEGRVVAVFHFVGLEPTLNALLLTVVCAIWVKAVLTLTARRQVGFTVARSARDLRLRLLDALMSARWSYFIHQPMGQVSNAFATEAERASGAYLYITTVVSLSIQALLYTGVAFAIYWQATQGGVVAAGVGLFVLRGLVTANRSAGAKQTKLMRSLLTHLSDTLQALKPLKAMAREERIAPILETHTLKLNRVARKRVMATEALTSIQEPIVVTCLATGAWACLVFLDMPWSQVLGLGIVFARTLNGLAKAQRQYQRFTSEESAFWAMLGTIEKAEHERETNKEGERASLEQSIRLRNVHLAYDDHVILADTNLEVPAGEITALVGPSGAGKTTISDLIIGLIEPDAGQVLIDGVPLEKVDVRAWRESIGYVPQEMFLLNDSISVNVTLGEAHLTPDQVEQALRRAGAWDFVEKLSEGMDTVVGERGARLSGGQRQRILIARALVHEPCLLILDEATTALDPETEVAVWDSLVRLKGQVTILAISHQPKLAQMASRVYRIEGGQARVETVASD